MKKLLVSICLLGGVFTLTRAQIEAVKLKEGTNTGTIKELVIVFKMHFDIGYTDLSTSVLNKYATTMVDETLNSVKETSRLPKNQQFAWTIPGWPMKYMLENATPKRKIGLKKALKDGRFRLHALPFTMETESSDLENLVRSMEYSSQINRKYGLPLTRDAKMTDVPSHSWIIPTLLTNAGVKILHIGCNPGSTSPDLPTLFWWEGPDGSRLLTFNWAEYYGSGLLPPKDWKYGAWLAMIHTHENTGAPRPEEVAKLLAEAKQKLPGVKVKIGQLSDFYDALMKDNPDIPVIKGDMPDTWIHGFMSMPREVARNKRMQRTIYLAEGLNTLNGIWQNHQNMIAPFINSCTEKMNLFDEHTFGLAISHGAGSEFAYDDDFILNRSRGYYNRAEVSWKEKAAYIDEAERKENLIVKEEMKRLAASVNVNGSRVVVFNPHPWYRSGEVSLFLSIYKNNRKITALKDTVTNRIINAFNKGNLLQFYAEDVPAMGYKTYIPVFDGEEKFADNEMIADEKNNVIENGYFKITISPASGALLSCIDKRSGRELVDSKSQFGFGEYVHEYFGSDELKRYNESYVKPGAHDWADPEMGRPEANFVHKLTRPSNGRLHYQRNGDELVVTYFGELQNKYPHRYNVSYVLNKNLPYIKMIWNVENKQADARPEGGWIAFPFKVEQPRFHLGRTGGVVNPLTDFIRNSNQDYYFLNTGFAITNAAGEGVGLNTPDAPGVSLDRPGLFRFSGVFKPQSPTVFVNLYNNQWGTNFTEWIEGSWSANMYIWSVDNYTNEKGLITPVEETRQPLAGFYIDDKAGNQPMTKEGVTLSKKGILVTSFVAVNDKKGYRLRLWEQAGDSGVCEVKIPAGNVKEAVLFNLRDEPLPGARVIPVINGTFKIEIKPYQPITLLLK
jgi:hypothetical protein